VSDSDYTSGKMEKLLCPSMMCADFGNLSMEIKSLEDAGADIFHIDIMDGRFVPNFGMGLQDVELICRKSRIPVDIHFMIEDPGRYIEKFAGMGVSILYIHPEADAHPMRTLQRILDTGMKAGIACNPGTAAAMVEPLLPLCDYVMVMSVNPGFAGQKYIDSVDKKIMEFVNLQKRYHYNIMLDGACSPEKIASCSKMGVNGFVLGTSALFGKGRSYKEIINELRIL
jgi:ribulose-phosphate 3-epimerase